MKRKWIIIFSLIVSFVVISSLFIYFYFNQSSKTNQKNTGYIEAVESSRRARDASLLNEMAEIYDAFDRYYQKNNYYPWQNGIDTNGQTIDRLNRNILQKLVDSQEIKEKLMGKIDGYGDNITLLNNGIKTYLCIEPQSKIVKAKAKEVCLNDNNIKETIICVNGYEKMCVSSDLGYSQYIN